MKTFEDMKHKIPEGATHYLEATDSLKFAWWDSKENVLLCPENSNEWQPALVTDEIYNPTPIPQTNIETPEEKEAFDNMESAASKEVEWVNGDECIYMNSKELHKFIGIDPTRNDFCYIKANCSAVNWVEVAKLSKPETPQQREELVLDATEPREALPILKQMIFSMKVNAHTFSNENVEEIAKEGRAAMALIDKLLNK